MALPSPWPRTLGYHERTKHYPGRYARALGHMDWATQPDPFRRFAGAPLLALDLVPAGEQPRYEPAFFPGRIPPEPLGRQSVSQLFHDSLALSAWKQAGGERWPLRVNPSSGNLHPTEGYLVAGPVAGLHDRAAVFHYAPREHALERRAELADETWAALAGQLPPGGVLVGLTSIHWREAWKYGERAFRYCHHDVGHAIGAVTVAAAGLGWEARLCEGVTDADLARLLGTTVRAGPRPRTPIVCWRSSHRARPSRSTSSVRSRSRCRPAHSWPTDWHGVPNRLSPAHGQDWPVIDEVAAGDAKARIAGGHLLARKLGGRLGEHACASPRAIRRCRCARSCISGGARWRSTAAPVSPARRSFRSCSRAVPGQGQIPFATLPWRPRVDLLLFVHRVEGVPPGLYILLRDPGRKETLRGLMAPGFAWTPTEGGPPSLPLFLLEAGDARRVAAQTSCGQAIAADGVFAAAMLAEYRAPIETFGSWFYRRLHWEAGVVGQQLYLEAEASGIRATGIGCFFDDLTHRTFGLTGDAFQVLYHFTMGGAIDDVRLQTVPPYQHLARGGAFP